MINRVVVAIKVQISILCTLCMYLIKVKNVY